ncbi:MAG: alanine racemase, partial [Pseudothermotoga sp.]
MKSIYDLPTPAFLADVDVMVENIKEMAKLCEQHGKELWPMVKTHKSVAIAKLQHEHGAKGFLVGTICEAERLVENGFEKIMLAYPLANPRNIERVISLAKKAQIILCFDNCDSAEMVNKLSKGTILEYLVKIDSGLHRFGVPPYESANLVDRLHRFRNFFFRGIATHPGHAYTKRDIEELKEVAKQECRSMADARENLQASGYEPQTVATGCTPTVRFILSCTDVN